MNSGFPQPSSAPRYQVILPDFRGHGESGAGEGPVTMEKHATDIVAFWITLRLDGPLCWGLYRRLRAIRVLAEYRGRVAALALFNTKAPSDSPEARTARRQAAAAVLETGTEPFFESMVPKLLGKTTGRAVPILWTALCG